MKLVRELRGIWSNFVSKISNFRKDGRVLERQREEERLRQLRMEKSEKSAKEKKQHDKKLKEMEKEEKSLKKKWKRREKDIEREKKTEIVWWRSRIKSVNVSKDEKQEKHLQLDEKNTLEKKSGRGLADGENRKTGKKGKTNLKMEKIKKVQEKETDEKMKELEEEQEEKMKELQEEQEERIEETEREPEQRIKELDQKQDEEMKAIEQELEEMIKEIEQEEQEQREKREQEEKSLGKVAEEREMEKEARVDKKEKEKEWRDCQLEVQKIQDARRVHMDKERQRKKEMMKKMFSPGELMFKPTDEGARHLGFSRKRTNKVLPQEKEEQSPERELKQDEPVCIPHFITVKPLHPEPEDDIVEDNPQEAPSNNFKGQEKPGMSKVEKLRAITLQPRPVGNLVQCCVQRDRKNRNAPTYRMFKEDTKELLMVARNIYNRNTFEMTLDETGNGAVGLLRYNRNCTEFTLYANRTKRGVNNEVPLVENHNEQELMTTLYNTSFRGLRSDKMSVILPCMCKRYSTEIILEKKAPLWDEDKKEYILNFNGRSKRPSTKNFQLIPPKKPELVVMQFGRTDEDWFLLDYSTPLNALQAFAISLSCFEAKK